jgi:hypothetical protein
VSDDPGRKPDWPQGVDPLRHTLLIVGAYSLALVATGAAAVLLIELFQAIGWWRPTATDGP